MIKGIYGFNIAVNDLSEATRRFEQLLGVSATPLRPADFAIEGISGVQLLVQGLRINLITSADPNTSVGRFLAKRGEGFFLLSLEVDDIERDVSALREQDMQFVAESAFQGAFGKVNFAHPRSAHGVQLEFIQPETE